MLCTLRVSASAPAPLGCACASAARLGMPAWLVLSLLYMP